MFRRLLQKQRITWFAVLAMLCQALLPTIAYTATSTDKAALTEVGKAFGVEQHCTAARSPSQHDGSSQPTSPQHHHNAHCPLCLADALDIGLPVTASSALPAIVAATSFYVFTVATYIPPVAQLVWVRAPPFSSDFATPSHC